ncbi:MAG: hypothetical protein K2P84_09235, partial [Undibacterium sp.]|nr:hypothetical protein [Undibacterium sp.]
MTIKDWLAVFFGGAFVAHVLLSWRKNSRNRMGVCAKCETTITPESAIGITASGQTHYYCSACGIKQKRIDRG